MAEVAARYIGDVFNAIVTVWLPDQHGQLTAMAGEGQHNDLREKSAAVWAFENMQNAGIGTDTLPGVKGFYTSLIVEEHAVGVMGIIPGTPQEFDSDERNLLEAFGNLLASALQRATIALQAEESRVDAEGEKMRNVLLSSISHDLRTPLSAIIGLSSGVLLSDQNVPAKVKEVLFHIHEQTSRLGRIVTNLLDITSLESGRMSLNRQPHSLEEVIGSAILRVVSSLKSRQVSSEIQGAGSPVEIDGLLIEQVFTNLLENAIRFTDENTGKIIIKVIQNADEVQISVSDNGVGFEPGTEEKIFEKFYKNKRVPGAGSGLGLAICRAILAVHGGTIWAQQNDMGGATLCMLLPKVAVPPSEPLTES